MKCGQVVEAMIDKMDPSKMKVDTKVKLRRSHWSRPALLCLTRFIESALYENRKQGTHLSYILALFRTGHLNLSSMANTRHKLGWGKQEHRRNNWAEFQSLLLRMHNMAQLQGNNQVHYKGIEQLMQHVTESQATTHLTNAVYEYLRMLTTRPHYFKELLQCVIDDQNIMCLHKRNREGKTHN